MAVNSLHITLVYSPRAREVHELALTLPAGSTVVQAVRASGLLAQFPDIDLHNHAAFSIGLWGRKTTANHVLRERDRIEIYRALQVDPKVARRERFQKQGSRTAGLFSKRRVGAKPGY